MLKRWSAFTRFLDDGRICLSNNAAERAIRPLAVGRRNWTFAGSDAGGHRAAALYTLIQTAKLDVVMSWTNADGTTSTMQVANNVEAYAPGSPIFLLGCRATPPGTSPTSCLGAGKRA